MPNTYLSKGQFNKWKEREKKRKEITLFFVILETFLMIKFMSKRKDYFMSLIQLTTF